MARSRRGERGEDGESENPASEGTGPLGNAVHEISFRVRFPESVRPGNPRQTGLRRAFRPLHASPEPTPIVRRPLRPIAAALAVLALGVDPAAGQEIDSPYRFVETRREISIFAGWFSGAEGRFGFGPKSGPTVAGRFGVGITDLFGLDAHVAFASLERDVVDPTGADGPRPVATASVDQYQAEIRARLQLTGRRTWNGIQPMLYFGIGLRGDFAGTQIGDLAVAEEFRYDPGTQFAANAGAIVRVILGDRWSLRAEAGALLYQLGTPGGYSDPELELGPVGENEWVQAPNFGLSLGYRF